MNEAAGKLGDLIYNNTERSARRGRPRDANGLRRGKRLVVKQRGGKCEACGWCPPDEAWTLLNLHHIVPVACGGSDDSENIVLLCPNDHAVAHWVGRRSGGEYHGPRNRDRLLEAL